ncbi:MAG TPA: hypothetical protein V6C89_15055 [Drouetiella sp.]
MVALQQASNALIASISILVAASLMSGETLRHPTVPAIEASRQEVVVGETAPRQKPAEQRSSQTASTAVFPTTAVATGPLQSEDSGGPFEPVNIAAMTSESELILVGKFKQVQGPRYLEIVHSMNNPHNKTAAIPLEVLRAQMFLTIECDRVLKGDKSLVGKRLKWIDPNWEHNIHTDTVHGVTFTNEYDGGIPQLNYGIFFLRKTKTGLQFVDLKHCVLPASPAPLEVKSDPTNAVVNELNHVLTTPLDLLSARGGALGEESGGGPGGTYELSSGELLMRDAVTVLVQLPKQEAIANLKAILNDSDSPLTKLWAFAGLAELGDWTCFSLVEKYLVQPPPNLTYVAAYPFYNLKSATYTEDGKALVHDVPGADLAKLLKSTNTDIRQSASSILRDKQDTSLVKALANAVVHDPDDTVRQNCSAALERMTGVVAELWEKEPALSLDIATGQNAILSFDHPMISGDTFEQNKIDPLVRREFAKPKIEPNQYPEWVTQGLKRLDARSEKLARTGWVGHSSSEYLPPKSERPWSWNGEMTSPNSLRKVWYTYQTTYDPSVMQTSEFTMRTTTLCFLVQRNTDKEPEITGIDQLPAAKILDVWRQDDDIIYKRLPRNGVRVIQVRRIYGSNGNPLQTAPSRLHPEARIFDID